MSEQELVERIADVVKALTTGIVPERVYPPDEAARLIGFRGAAPERSIARLSIPTVWITPEGRLRGYYGRDLIAYIEDQRRSA